MRMVKTHTLSLARGSYPWIWHVQGFCACEWKDFQQRNPLETLKNFVLTSGLGTKVVHEPDLNNIHMIYIYVYLYIYLDMMIVMSFVVWDHKREQENHSNADMTTMFDCRGVESSQMLSNQLELLGVPQQKSPPNAKGSLKDNERYGFVMGQLMSRVIHFL